MSTSWSTTRTWFTASSRRLLASRERSEDIRLRDDADQVFAIHHGQGADLVLQHQASRIPRLPVWADHDHALGHHLLDREAGEEVVDLPHGQARRLRGQIETDVAVGHDAD